MSVKIVNFSSNIIASIFSLILGVILFIVKSLGSNFDNLYNERRVEVSESTDEV